MTTIINSNTGQVQHPHPMFDTWGEQIEWFVRRDHPEFGSYVGQDSAGNAFCGGVSHDKTLPCGVVQLCAPLVIARPLSI